MAWRHIMSANSTKFRSMLEFTFRWVHVQSRYRKQTFYSSCVLSSINRLFDPLGLTPPVTIAGKSLLREAMTHRCRQITKPDGNNGKFASRNWKILWYLECIVTCPLLRLLQRNCDASETAIAAVAYTHLTDSSGHQMLGFILGKAKLAPKHGHTIPRLELCAAVLATELYNTIHSELDIEFEAVKFFSDSKVVLGYIFNDTKRFFTYVANRVERIRRCSGTMSLQNLIRRMKQPDLSLRRICKPVCGLMDQHACCAMSRMTFPW